MALKVVHMPDVLSLNQVPEVPSVAFSSSSSLLHPQGVEVARSPAKTERLVVIGHRGKGMNALASPDRRMREVKENSILSFNAAGHFPVNFVEFDVQVTTDGCPIIFHDNFIVSEENVGKSLFRKMKDGKVHKWNVEIDDPFGTLQETFQKVDSHLGFNIELKFDDNIVYQDDELIGILQSILKVIYEFAKDRPIIFSSFQPDAARLMQKNQSRYPVFFLTNGGQEIYRDTRRNSLDEAIKLCLSSGMQGIVAEVKSILKNPTEISRIKESNLSLLTYGQLNNIPEVVYMQHLMGINGVIVDLVQEITEVVTNFTSIDTQGDDESLCSMEM